jgi:murein L,D-transpeptidase YcbB/YkuD
MNNVIQLPVQRRRPRPGAAANAPTGEPLSAACSMRAAVMNATLVAEQGLTPADLGIDAAPHTIAFSQRVARLQEQHGLPVDGIVDPHTAAALAGGRDRDD